MQSRREAVDRDGPAIEKIRQILLARPEVFTRQGKVVATWRNRNGRRLGPYYHLAYRDQGRQRSVYLGRRESLAEEVRCLLDGLRRPGVQTRLYDRLERQARAALRATKALWAQELAKHGLRLKGGRVRGWHKWKTAAPLPNPAPAAGQSDQICNLLTNSTGPAAGQGGQIGNLLTNSTGPAAGQSGQIGNLLTNNAGPVAGQSGQIGNLLTNSTGPVAGQGGQIGNLLTNSTGPAARQSGQIGNLLTNNAGPVAGQSDQFGNLLTNSTAPAAGQSDQICNLLTNSTGPAAGQSGQIGNLLPNNAGPVAGQSDQIGNLQHNCAQLRRRVTIT